MTPPRQHKAKVWVSVESRGSRTYTERDKRHIVSALKRLYETHGNFSDTDIPVSITYQKEQFVDYLTKRDTASNSANYFNRFI